MTAFHITEKRRNRLGIDDHKIFPGGKTEIEDLKRAESIHSRLSDQPENLKKPSPGEIYAAALLDEVYCYLLENYYRIEKKAVFSRCLDSLNNQQIKPGFREFTRGYYSTFFQGTPGKEDSDTSQKWRSFSGLNEFEKLREFITLGLAYNNRAYLPLRELFISESEDQNSLTDRIFSLIRNFFDSVPGPHGGLSIIRFLSLPAEHFPDSIMDQLQFVIENWADLLGPLRTRLLSGLDKLKEEKKNRAPGPGKTLPLTYPDHFADHENYSKDSDWMASLVLLAKSTYVWLDQLSGRYGRSIRKLDQIPVEELDLIASQGFSGLWLIGIWERSPASAEIKRRTGNPEAMSSAYSIYDYTIAGELGGEEAFLILKKAASERGIRLAGDMVPNHMGIDSKWVCGNPDLFISSDSPPFMSYSFNGPDLSTDPAFGIYLEDHYYDRSDASVVFKLIDRHSGRERYVYHGNDGTSMPWNDTAQLNYLKKEVREKILDTIIRISKKFDILRFDAAMVLTQKHFKRLWYPDPGSGGDIPSRSGTCISEDQFRELYPREFWLDVVDRTAKESPGTLLLAEAFWMMEPYFVRTLGMHRVYNSAFMNFLKNEDNVEFRRSIKNTIEFDPRILKRFANFMNNPDEETAVTQFGKGDKYFGVCTLLSTLPGLPLFGHGQIEGFSEKYGMEYRKAYLDETPDSGFVARHRKEIFPLLRRRRFFAHSEFFRLYDFISSEGGINEDVIAYSNSNMSQHSLVVFNNRYSHCSGIIRNSSPFVRLSADGEKTVLTDPIGKALGLNASPGHFTLFRDHSSSLTFIRRSGEIIEKGIYLDLRAYQYHAFLDFSEVKDESGEKYRKIHDFLEGKGCDDPDQIYNKYIRNPFASSLEILPDTLKSIGSEPEGKNYEEKIASFREQFLTGSGFPPTDSVEFRRLTRLILETLSDREKLPESFTDDGDEDRSRDRIKDFSSRADFPAIVITAFIINGISGELMSGGDLSPDEFYKKYYIPEILIELFTRLGIPGFDAEETAKLALLLSRSFFILASPGPERTEKDFIPLFILDPVFQSFIKMNEFEGKKWYDSNELILAAGMTALYQWIVTAAERKAGTEILPFSGKINPPAGMFRVFVDSDKDAGNRFDRLSENLKKRVITDS